jgi:hypothetical protein
MREVAKLFLVFILLIFYFLCPIWQGTGFCVPLSGSVEEKDYLLNKASSGTIVDLSTGRPVSGAKIEIPSKGVSSYSDSNGKFSINASTDNPAIMSVKANGYKPFSLTISQEQSGKSLILGITKSSDKDIVIDTSLHHLGDDNYSEESANSDNFKLKSDGPVFSKTFYVENIPGIKNYILKIGSIIGIDTNIAGRLGQSRTTTYSSPTKIYINSQQIGEFRINGDNQQIILSPEHITQNSQNRIVIETGRNLFARYIDYDDMEFINITLELR